MGSKVRSTAVWAPPPGQDQRTAPLASCQKHRNQAWGRRSGSGCTRWAGDSRGRVTGTPPAVVHTLRETRGSSVLRMLKSLTKKKKSLVGCEATRFSSSGSAFLIPEVMSNQGSAAHVLSGWSLPQPACHPSWVLTHSKQLDPLPLQLLGSWVHQVLGLPICDEDADLGRCRGQVRAASDSETGVTLGGLVGREITLGTPDRASWGRKTWSATWRIAAPVRVLPPL